MATTTPSTVTTFIGANSTETTTPPPTNNTIYSIFISVKFSFDFDTFNVTLDYVYIKDAIIIIAKNIIDQYIEDKNLTECNEYNITVNLHLTLLRNNAINQKRVGLEIRNRY